jgi:hypothetical protein
LGLLSTAAQHHKVIGVAHHAITPLLDLTVQGMQIDVRQQRTDDSTHAIANFEFERVVSYQRTWNNS